MIRRAVDAYLTQEEADSSAWQGQWKKAVQGTAGIAPYLDEGAEYVEDLRSEDAKRLSGFEA